MIKVNASEAHRAIEAGKSKVNKLVAKKISEVLWEEFEQLVKETPQYTGTAAASWNIAAQHPGGGVREQKLNEGGPLSYSHPTAVNIALSANMGNLEAFADKDFIYKDLFIWNDADSAVYAERGPLRGVNDPPGPGAFARFQERLASLTLTIHEDIII